MPKKNIFPIMFGLIGVTVLLSLAVWQMQRLEWKQDIISKIEERLSGEPLSLINNYKLSLPSTHNYLRVYLDGNIKNNEAHIYAPQKNGLGYRVVSEFEWNDVSILVDLGDDSFTPKPDIVNNIWFSRFVPIMARELNVEPFLVVAEEVQIKENGNWKNYEEVTPLPISLNIQNDHKEYAITWFSLALVWFLMTIYLLWRIKQKTV